MFGLLVSGMQAYNQLGLFLGALFCLAIGSLLEGNALYRRVHSFRANGVIIGVIASGNTYAPVYRYALGGQTHVARSMMSSSLVHGKETGRTVRLLISPHNPCDATQAGDWTGEIVGLVFVVPGVWLAWTAVTAFPVTPMTWAMAAGFSLYLLERVLRVFMRKGPHTSIAQWVEMIRQGVTSDIDMSQVKPIESLVPAAALKTTWRDHVARQRKVAPLVVLLVIGLAGVGIYEGDGILRLEAGGLRAPGLVVGLDESSNTNGGWTYYGVVRYRVLGGFVQFRDRVGGNPPMLREGETVSVLYLPGAPSAAIVDRGWVGNLLLPVGLLAVSIFLAWLSWVMLATPLRPMPDATSAAKMPAE